MLKDSGTEPTDCPTNDLVAGDSETGRMPHLPNWEPVLPKKERRVPQPQQDTVGVTIAFDSYVTMTIPRGTEAVVVDSTTVHLFVYLAKGLWLEVIGPIPVEIGGKRNRTLADVEVRGFVTIALHPKKPQVIDSARLVHDPDCAPTLALDLRAVSEESGAWRLEAGEVYGKRFYNRLLVARRIQN